MLGSVVKILVRCVAAHKNCIPAAKRKKSATIRAQIMVLFRRAYDNCCFTSGTCCVEALDNIRVTAFHDCADNCRTHMLFPDTYFLSVRRHCILLSAGVKTCVYKFTTSIFPPSIRFNAYWTAFFCLPLQAVPKLFIFFHKGPPVLYRID